MKDLTMSMVAWAVVLGIYALAVKVVIWALAACNLVVLPFFPVFVGVLALRVIIGRRG